MEHNTLKETDFVVDLESGGPGCEEDTKNDPIPGNKRTKSKLSISKSGVSGFDGSAKGECSVNSHSNLGNPNEVPLQNIELLIDKNSGQSGEHVPLVEKEHVKEKRKRSSKKASKPPRPPKGPSLDTADMKLVKEISELAMNKRSRIERMKALKKMKAAKSSSSSNSSLCAVVVTLLFCLVIIFQGICSRNHSNANFLGSPEPAAAATDLISVQLYNNLPASDSIRWSSESPNSVEHDSQDEVGGVAG